MCEIASPVTMFKVPENYADDMTGDSLICMYLEYNISACFKKSPLQMKLKQNPIGQSLGSNHNSRCDTAEAG